MGNVDRRQAATYAVIIIFMAVTVGHVANYAGQFEPAGWRWLGWLYALGVDASIIVCAWLTRWKTTSRWAWVGYVGFVVASGALNIAQVAPHSLGAWVYAVFPTAAQAVLGFLARDAGGFTHTSRGEDDKARELRAALKESSLALKAANDENKRLSVILAETERKLTAPFAEEMTKNSRRQVSTQTARNIMSRDGWACYYCGRDLQGEARHKIHVDHFYPSSNGGGDNEFNLVVSCESCNLSKSAQLPSERQVRDFKVYLVNNSALSLKEKVWVLHATDILPKQKDIARVLGTSPSYVSSSVAEMPDSPNGKFATFCEQLDSVGLPQETPIEQDSIQTE